MSKIKQLWNGSDVSDNNSLYNPDNVGYPGEEDEPEVCKSCGDGIYVHKMFEDNGRALDADLCNNCGADWSMRPTLKADF